MDYFKIIISIEEIKNIQKLQKYTESITPFLYIYKYAKQYWVLFKNILTENKTLKTYMGILHILRCVGEQGREMGLGRRTQGLQLPL